MHPLLCTTSSQGVRLDRPQGTVCRNMDRLLKKTAFNYVSSSFISKPAGFIVLITLFLLLQFTTSALYAASPEKPVTVLLYHRFNEPDYPSTNISRKALIQQMEFLKAENYRTIDILTFRDILNGKVRAKGNEILVTVDDGYKSVYETAWPIFKSYDVPFVVFLSTRAIEEGYRSIMTWDMIDEMRKDGVVFANHTHRHPHLGSPEKPGEKESQYRRRIREEITTAAIILKKHAIKNNIFAYPYGEYNPIIVEELKKAGYDLMFSQNPGVAWYGADKTRIDRMAIVGENISQLKFEGKLSRFPLKAAIKEPSGTFYKKEIAKISIRIAEPLKYLPGQVNLFLSEKGRLDYSYNRETGELYVDGPIVLTRSLNRIILTAREIKTGRFGMMSWLLLRDTR